MTNSLTTLFKAIASSPNEQTLKEEVIPEIGTYFAAKRCGLFLLNQLPPQVSNLGKRAFSLKHNPVLNYVWEHHAPVHENILLPAAKWQAICPRFDHGHVMAGPIVADGGLIGGLGVTRDRLSNAFNPQDLIDMTGLCLHVSTFIVQHQLSAKESSSTEIKLLTPREMAIAKLVACGLTNAEIGQELWIQENSVKQALKRMFRKLNISSRTSLVSLLLQ
jgi:DNA-binding CsgD family transcriptional regulator